MPNRCVAAGCGNTARHSSDWNEAVSLHRFPRSEPLLSAWIRGVQLNLPASNLGSTSVICSKHFDDDCFENKATYINKLKLGLKPEVLRLKKNAVPRTTTTFQSPTPSAEGPRAESMRKRVVRNLLAEQESTSSDPDTDELGWSSDDSFLSDDCQDDPDWIPPISPQSASREFSIGSKDVHDYFNIGVPVKETKVVVEMSQLFQLLKNCINCQVQGDMIDISGYHSGAYFKAQMVCNKCMRTWTWSNSTDKVRYNGMFCGSTLFTGQLPTRISEYMNANHILFPSSSLFHYYQSTTGDHGGLLHRIVLSQWLDQQKENIEESKRYLEQLHPKRKGKGKRKKVPYGVKLAGDGRNDSMGYCAQYGTYSMMDVDTRKILELKTVSRVETGMNSYQTELEGLKRCLASMKEQLPILAIITDRHAQIRVHLQKSEPHIKHFYDCWHLVKAIQKNLTNIGKRRDCSEELTKERVHSICNRLYAMAQWTEADDKYALVMEEKRKAILNHLIGIHQHRGHVYYKKCTHRQTQQLTMDKHGEAYSEVRKYLNKKEIASAICRMTPYGQTSRLESFHHVILKFAPKHISFGFHGMESRMRLAAMHYNENCNRGELTNEDDQPLYRTTYVKWQGGKAKVVRVLAPTTNEYIEKLMTKLWIALTEREFSDLPALSSKPPTMTSQLDKENKEHALTNYRSRFLNT